MSEFPPSLQRLTDDFGQRIENLRAELDFMSNSYDELLEWVDRMMVPRPGSEND